MTSPLQLPKKRGATPIATPLQLACICPASLTHLSPPYPLGDARTSWKGRASPLVPMPGDWKRAGTGEGTFAFALCGPEVIR